MKVGMWVTHFIVFTGFHLLLITQRISVSLYHKSSKTILQDVSMLQQSRGNGPFQMELLMKWQDSRCH